MSTERPRRIFGRTSLALAGAAVLAPVVGFLIIRHDWAGHDFSIELAAEGFVVTMFAVVATGFFALCALIAGGIGLARKEPDRWTGGIGLTLGTLGVAAVLAVAAIVYSSSGKGSSSGMKPVDSPASTSPDTPKPEAIGGAPR
jgi:hypothetical protein